MLRPLTGLFFFALTSLHLSVLAPSWVFAGGKLIPPSPENYVYIEEEVERLSEHYKDPDASSRIDQVLSEQESTTAEQIVVAVFSSLDGEDVADYSNRVFRAWKIGQKQRNNGVLLALYVKDRKMRIEVGYGLEALLTDARSKRIIENSLVPRLKDDDLWGALKYGVYDILKTIESPIVQNGRAKEILWSGAVPRKIRQASSSSFSTPALLAFLFLLGVIIFIARVFFSMVSDAHYTSTGWRKTRSWSSRRSDGFGGWGSSSGSSGAGSLGGFLGGGGSSGGGGASGRW